uniref:Putative secreted protein n=1 Tax=Anopheles marajoara TaxID=58244 RepID=A0A2M4CBH9_9DIPT
MRGKVTLSLVALHCTEQEKECVDFSLSFFLSLSHTHSMFSRDILFLLKYRVILFQNGCVPHLPEYTSVTTRSSKRIAAWL